MVTPDGISTEDWDRVHELAVMVVNASADGDDEAGRQASALLSDTLDTLQVKYGPLPSLLATRADYAERVEDREYWFLAAYEQARLREDAKNLVWIAESLASLYIEELSDRTRGAEWLATLERHLQMVPADFEVNQAVRLRAVLGDSDPAGRRTSGCS